jgi:large subunit ribosomal protein L16
MKQYPSKLKFRKYQKINETYLKILQQKYIIPGEGQYAIKSIIAGKLTFKQIESARKCIKRTFTDKTFKIRIKVFTYQPFTQKSVASRMGKGKGKLVGWFCPIRAGQIIFEILGPSGLDAFRALKKP